MNETIRIEEYKKNYAENIIELILKIQRNEYGISITKEDQPDLCSVEMFYLKKNGNFYVALKEQEVVGTIGLLDIGNRQGALRKMFVKKEYRGKEYIIARQLLEKLFEWAREKKYQEIYLGTTARFIAAHRFYEKNGFIEVTKDELPLTFPVMKVDSKFYKYIL